MRTSQAVHSCGWGMLPQVQDHQLFDSHAAVVSVLTVYRSTVRTRGCLRAWQHATNHTYSSLVTA